MNHREKYPWLYDVIFLLVFLLAGYLRLTGSNWGDNGGQHPDENHFSGVLSAIHAQSCADPSLLVEACPPDQMHWLSLGEYFNSQTSPLNPYNRGFGSYVYGNLPMTIVRVVADATEEAEDLRVLGRQFSAFADLFAIMFLYLIVTRLYGRRVALLASLFSALTVMQIQQSHFFTVDLFANAFAFLALWFAVAILEHREQRVENREEGIGDRAESGEQSIESHEPLPVKEPSNEVPATDLPPAPPSSFSLNTSYILLLLRNPLFLLSLGFGFALGMAMASKINIAPLAIVLPGAFLLRYLVQRKESDHLLTTGNWKLAPDREAWILLIIICLIAGGLATIISFRIFQPYAFDGIGFDTRWVEDIKQQRAQAKGDADLPWNLQWARRSHLFSFTNL
ncbi:MAG TPA: glycosyltransferase family 39 protein, partial [Anaerolineales bacterium]|nr:glycosyltransferase family 39 protein [Anaerolineales bacterium]